MIRETEPATRDGHNLTNPSQMPALRRPLSADPTSVTTRNTVAPRPVAHAVTRTS